MFDESLRHGRLAERLVTELQAAAADLEHPSRDEARHILAYLADLEVRWQQDKWIDDAKARVRRILGKEAKHGAR